MVPFLLRFWYDAVLDWGLNPGPPALKASTIPLGYRGGGDEILKCPHALAYVLQVGSHIGPGHWV